MYTVLWKEGDLDRWDRFETKEEVSELLKELREDPDAWCLEDVWIFGPEADDYAVTGDMFGLD